MLFSYANLMIFCLFAKMGQAAVPAAWSLFEHVGHFLGDLHWSSSSCVLAHFLQTGGTEHTSSGWPKVQHFRHSDGLGMYFFYGEYFVSDGDFPW
jgi:hypothetical protein